MPQQAPNLSQYLYQGPSVSYSTDPTQQAAALQQLQQYVQQNPGDTNAQAFLAEQQNIINYTNTQSGLSTDTTNLTNLESAASQSAAASNQGADTSSWNNINTLSPYIVQQMQSGQLQLNQQQLQTLAGIYAPAGSTPPDLTSMPLSQQVQLVQQYLTNNPGTQNPIFTNAQLSSIAQNAVTQQQQTVNNQTNANNTAQQSTISGYTLPTVNTQGMLGAENTYLYGPSGQPVTGANEGVVNATLDPMVADAYRTRYVAGQGINAKLNTTGNANSGAAVGAQNNASQQTMGTLANESNQVYSTAANQQQSLATNLANFNQTQGAQQANTQEQQTTGAFNTSANQNQNDWLSNFNTQIGQNLANQNTNFQQSEANQDSLNNVATAGGAIIGSVVGGL